MNLYDNCKIKKEKCSCIQALNIDEHIVETRKIVGVSPSDNADMNGIPTIDKGVVIFDAQLQLPLHSSTNPTCQWHPWQLCCWISMKMTRRCPGSLATVCLVRWWSLKNTLHSENDPGQSAALKIAGKFPQLLLQLSYSVKPREREHSNMLYLFVETESCSLAPTPFH